MVMVATPLFMRVSQNGNAISREMPPLVREREILPSDAFFSFLFLFRYGLLHEAAAAGLRVYFGCGRPAGLAMRKKKKADR